MVQSSTAMATASNLTKTATLLTLSLIFCFTTTLLSASSDLKTLSAAEIQLLLNGNTAVGNWDDAKYRQFFDTNGMTIFAQEGTRSAVGRWRVDEQNDQYESWWEMSGWSGYSIARDANDNLFWISSSLPPQQFDMLPGQQLVKK